MSDSNYWKVVSLLLFGVVIITVGYLGNDYYQVRVTDIYNEGYNNASIDMGLYLIDRATKCESIDLVYDTNKSLNLIAIQCLPEEVVQYLQQGVQNGN